MIDFFKNTAGFTKNDKRIIQYLQEQGVTILSTDKPYLSWYHGKNFHSCKNSNLTYYGLPEVMDLINNTSFPKEGSAIYNNVLEGFLKYKNYKPYSNTVVYNNHEGIAWSNGRYWFVMSKNGSSYGFYSPSELEKFKELQDYRSEIMKSFVGNPISISTINENDIVYNNCSRFAILDLPENWIDTLHDQKSETLPDKSLKDSIFVENMPVKKEEFIKLRFLKPERL